MFARQRKARVLFGLSDIVLAAVGFEAAYRTRSFLRLENLFFLTPQQKVLVLGSALVALVAVARWLEIYEKLDSAHPRIILRDTFRQVAYSALCLVVLEYALRDVYKRQARTFLQGGDPFLRHLHAGMSAVQRIRLGHSFPKV